MDFVSKYLPLAGVLFLAVAPAQSREVPPLGSSSGATRRVASGDALALRRVRTLAVGSWSGDRGFRRRMQRDISALGFGWVASARQADAMVSARTSWKRGGFAGELWIRDRAGKLLWHERAFRPPSSNYMASDRLAVSLRRALGRR
jgi:hypothetical protein